jgi:hypothetical protein
VADLSFAASESGALLFGLTDIYLAAEINSQSPGGRIKTIGTSKQIWHPPQFGVKISRACH